MWLNIPLPYLTADDLVIWFADFSLELLTTTMRCTNEVNTTGTKNFTHSKVKQYVGGLGGGLHGHRNRQTYNLITTR